MTIKSFKCKDTQALFLGERVPRWVNVERPALRKLEQLDWSAGLDAAAREEALRWALQRGSRSGRVAWQFARDWVGRHSL